MELFIPSILIMTAIRWRCCGNDIVYFIINGICMACIQFIFIYLYGFVVSHKQTPILFLVIHFFGFCVGGTHCTIANETNQPTNQPSRTKSNETNANHILMYTDTLNWLMYVYSDYTSYRIKYECGCST